MGRLTAAVLVSSAGDPLSLTVSLVLLYGATGSPMAIAGAYLAQMAGVVAVGGLFGGIADRADRRRLIVRLEVIRTVVVAVLPLATLLSVFLLYPALVLLGAIESLVQPARQAAVPRLVGSDQIGPANSLLLTALSVAQALGFAVAALALMHLSNLRLLYLADASTFAVAGLLVFTLGDLGGGVRAARLQGGVRRALHVKGAGPLLAVAAATVFFVGMLNPTLLPLAYALSRQGPTAYSLLQICLIGGLFAGSIAAGRVLAARRHDVMAGSLWLFACATLAIGLAPTIGLAALALFMSGSGNAVYSVTNLSALMQVADDSNRGTVLAARFTLTQAFKAVGLGAGAVATGWLGPHGSYVLIGVGLLVVASGATLFAVGRPRVVAKRYASGDGKAR